ncbi:NAD(P)H-hydrate dehydratase [Caulobacter segnis]
MTKTVALDTAWVRDHPLPEPGDQGKHGRGQVLVVGGEAELAGAAMLAGVAALRAGAGKLQVAVAQSAVAVLSVALPEARILALPRDKLSSAADLVIQHASRCDALLIGPGMMDDRSGLAATLLTLRTRGPVVVDAGALLAVPGAPRQPGLVLTPNAGEMARLLAVSKEEIDADLLAAARKAATQFDAVVVMKGAVTFVVGPDGSAARYAGGGPGLGVSGSGDVLGGLITGLLARGASAFEAAAWGVFLHGEGGARLAGKIGRLGFLAREIADEAPLILSSF